MIAPIPIRAAHHGDAIEGLQRSFVWLASQIAELFTSCRHPERSARTWLSQLEQTGYVCSALVDVVEVDCPPQPLVTHRIGDANPDFDALEYFLRQRWNIASKRRRVYWPSPSFALAYGLPWMGSDCIDAPQKVSHDVLCTSVWLHYFAHRRELATNRWISERQLQYITRRGQHSGAIPDAIVNGEHGQTAVEIAGSYDAKYLRKHSGRFFEAGLNWELW